MSFKYANTEMYVLKIISNALGIAKTTRQDRNHTESR